MGVPDLKVPIRTVGRYALYEEIGSGGMATIHLGKLQGPAGFAPVVAIKRMHQHLGGEHTKMFLDEARLAGCIRHPNVVPVLDVVDDHDELFIVMEYVHGVALSTLMRANGPVAPEIASAIMCGVLLGLHAAHEAISHDGEPLGIVHRDVSPQNIILGLDGVARVLDFGVAKARGRAQSTIDGQIKGKLGYMAPEQIRGGRVNRQADVFAAGVVLWELATGQRLFEGDDVGEVVGKVLFGDVSPPSSHVAELPAGLDEVVRTALAAERSQRFATAREFALALQRHVPPASPAEVGALVEAHADETRRRARLITSIEQSDAVMEPPTSDAVTAKPRRRAKRRVAWSIAAAAVLIIVALVVMRRREDLLPASAGVATAPTPVRVEAAAQPALAPVKPAEPVTTQPKPRSDVRPAKAKRPASRGARDCDPPYTREPGGRKIYKRECL